MTNAAHLDAAISKPYSNKSPAYIRKASITLPSMCVITRLLKGFFCKRNSCQEEFKIKLKMVEILSLSNSIVTDLDYNKG